MKNFIKKLSIKTFSFWFIFILGLILIVYGGYFRHYLLSNHDIFGTLTTAPESIKATAYLVGDLKSGRILISRNKDLHLFPASLSKLMTGEIVLDNFSLNQLIYITPYIISTEGEEGDLKIGEILKVEDLLKILLISSSNDAAAAFAEALDKKGTDFVDLMNEKAQKLDLYNTAFFGETGLDRKGNFTTVEDLFKLSQDIYKNYPLLGEITRKLEDTVFSNDGQIKHYLKNTNILAGQLPYLWLGKTGSTPDAKDCLLTIFEIPLKDDRISVAIIILNSTDRFGDTVQLYDWVREILGV
ncbi:MAG: serine hydrolase [Candidatus Paceibacterota bacterium]|jgi:D-alanyl-D-alanine carboxypeptidase (penicillin-binding protein 5/6)